MTSAAKRVMTLLAFLMVGLVVWFYYQMARGAREQMSYKAQRTGLLSLDSAQAAYFAQGPGVEVQITYASMTGWTARSSYVRSDYICALFVGVVPDIPMTIRDHVVDTPGTIYCENHGMMPTRR